MKIYKAILGFVVIGLIAGTAFAVNYLKANQKLGKPGIIAEPIAGSPLMKFDFPEHVLDCLSTNLPQQQVVLDYLPKDTSYASRAYQAPDGLLIVGNIILQGADRSSIHNADYCLAGSGATPTLKSVVNIPIAGPEPYELPVARWNTHRTIKNAVGQVEERYGVYVFWFVAENEQTPSYKQHLLRLYHDTLFTGVLQRWAYVSYQAEGLAGEEDALFERMKQLIAVSVPQFQFPPKPAGSQAVAGK